MSKLVDAIERINFKDESMVYAVVGSSGWDKSYIDWFKSRGEAEKYIKQLEEIDKKNKEYEPNFYQIKYIKEEDILKN